MLALALPATLFEASTKPSARFWLPFWPVVVPVPPVPPLVEAVVVLPIVEVMVTPSTAPTVSSPVALTVVSSIVAVALDGFSPLKACREQRVAQQRVNRAEQHVLRLPADGVKRQGHADRSVPRTAAAATAAAATAGRG